MESWGYDCRGKGFVSDDSASGGIASSRNNLMGSELKSPWSYGSPVMCSSHGGVENQDFVDLGSSNTMRKSLPSDTIGDILAGKISYGVEISSTTTLPNAFSGEDESSSKFSSSIVESNCRESSSLIDLKLGRLSDHRDGKNFSSSELNPKLSSAESPMPAKRTRAGVLASQRPYCQVHGCRKDLSSCKDYHKRHKVCEIHSKTPTVIVNGIEQRFCQQCSRFHLLDEFDDGKRSCRKRLAGHNERRRKPQMRMHAGRVGRLFQSFDATRYQGNEFSASSFVCEDILPGGLLSQQKYEISNSSRLLKLEDGVDLSSHLPIPTTNGVMKPKSLFTSNYSGRQCPSVLGDGTSSSAINKINENGSYLQEIAVSDFASRPIFHNSSVGNEDMSVLNSSLSIQGLSDISNSDRAHSLLSSQSQSPSTHSSGIQRALPLITSGRRALYPVTQQHENLLGLSSQAPTSGMSTLFHSSLMNSVEENHMDSIVISAGGTAVGSGIDEIIQRSPNLTGKSQLSCTDLSTINLLQLSSQLQRVEHQRQSLSMKREDDAFSGLRSI